MAKAENVRLLLITRVKMLTAIMLLTNGRCSDVCVCVCVCERWELGGGGTDNVVRQFVCLDHFIDHPQRWVHTQV